MLSENACENNGPANGTITFCCDILSTRVLSVFRLGKQSAKAGMEVRDDCALDTFSGSAL